MHDEPAKVSKLTIRPDRPIGISSIGHGANVDAIGFNLMFIAERKPKLATDLLKLWREASELRPEDPKAHGEDYAAAEAELRARSSSFEP